MLMHFANEDNLGSTAGFTNPQNLASCSHSLGSRRRIPRDLRRVTWRFRSQRKSGRLVPDRCIDAE